MIFNCRNLLQIYWEASFWLESVGNRDAVFDIVLVKIWNRKMMESRYNWRGGCQSNPQSVVVVQVYLGRLPPSPGGGGGGGACVALTEVRDWLVAASGSQVQLVQLEPVPGAALLRFDNDTSQSRARVCFLAPVNARLDAPLLLSGTPCGEVRVWTLPYTRFCARGSDEVSNAQVKRDAGGWRRGGGGRVQAAPGGRLEHRARLAQDQAGLPRLLLLAAAPAHPLPRHRRLGVRRLTYCHFSAIPNCFVTHRENGFWV